MTASRSEEDQHDKDIEDDLPTVLRRAIVFHLVLHRITFDVDQRPIWRFPYTFESDDLAFSKERLVEVLLAQPVSPLPYPLPEYRVASASCLGGADNMTKILFPEDRAISVEQGARPRQVSELLEDAHGNGVRRED